MTRRVWLNVVAGGVFAVSVLSSNAVRAQGPGPGGPGGEVHAFGGPMELMGFEGMHGGKLVKGAPFSASSTAETTQTLQDGTAIHRTSQGALYRDSEGRSRREMTFTGMGPMAAGGPHKMIVIFDPVAGVHYMLHVDEKIADKMSMRDHGGKPGASGDAENLHQKMQAHEQQAEASGAVKKESLGTQMVNGVSAEGTRVTHTIAVGEIGNDKPISVVSEHWFSPELQTVVKSSRSDPRFGTTTFSLTNIQKTEPAAALFTVPADYTVKEGGPGGHGHHGGAMPADAPAPVNNN